MVGGQFGWIRGSGIYRSALKSREPNRSIQANEALVRVRSGHVTLRQRGYTYRPLGTL